MKRPERLYYFNILFIYYLKDNTIDRVKLSQQETA